MEVDSRDDRLLEGFWDFFIIMRLLVNHIFILNFKYFHTILEYAHYFILFYFKNIH